VSTTTSTNAELGTKAREIWEASQPAAGTLVEQYLRSRAITLAIPPTLRFHPGLRHPSGLIAPAMVALVQDLDGRPTAILRTWLRKPIFGTSIGKADLEPNKMALGPITGSAVRLGHSRPKVALAEGIETALSVRQMTGLVCWAGMGGNLAGVLLPPEVREVVLAVDGDQAGADYARTLTRRFKDRRVRLLAAPKDATGTTPCVVAANELAQKGRPVKP
jgi:hypothetical protein